MDRLVKPDVKEVELSFKSGQKCSSVFRLTNLMHTMSVAVSLTTTNPSRFSFSQPFSVIPPLSSTSYSLLLSQPLDQPPLCYSLHGHDVITVRSAMLPTGKAHADDFRRLFSVPGRHVFMDAAIPISFVGPHVVEYLISHHTEIPDLSSSLGKAISGCSDSQLKKLIKLAIESQNQDLVSALIDAGAEVNGKDPDGKSLLTSAVKAGNIDVVKVLIASGCRVDNSVDRVLHDAAAMNRVDLIELLCKSFGNKLEVNSPDSEGQTPVHIAAAGGHVEALRFLLSAGGNAEVRDRKGWTALHCSAAEGHYDVVECLLERSNSKYVVDREGKTAFALAAENGHLELLAPLRVNDALHRAARLGDVNGVKSCLAEGASVNGKDQNGWTPLHRAAFKGGIECVRVLLKHGAQVDAVDDAGYTPLHCAVEAGHAPVAMLLIAHGARLPNVKSVKGSLALNLDRFKNQPALVVNPFCHEKERV